MPSSLDLLDDVDHFGNPVPKEAQKEAPPVVAPPVAAPPVAPKPVNPPVPPRASSLDALDNWGEPAPPSADTPQPGFWRYVAKQALSGLGTSGDALARASLAEGGIIDPEVHAGFNSGVELPKQAGLANAVPDGPAARYAGAAANAVTSGLVSMPVAAAAAPVPFVLGGVGAGLGSEGGGDLAEGLGYKDDTWQKGALQFGGGLLGGFGGSMIRTPNIAAPASPFMTAAREAGITSAVPQMAETPGVAGFLSDTRLFPGTKEYVRGEAGKVLDQYGNYAERVKRNYVNTDEFVGQDASGRPISPADSLRTQGYDPDRFIKELETSPRDLVMKLGNDLFSRKNGAPPNLGREELNVLAQGLLDRFGRTGDGSWSPTQFYQNYQKLLNADPKAPGMGGIVAARIFKGGSTASTPMAKDFDRLVQLSQGLQNTESMFSAAAQRSGLRFLDNQLIQAGLWGIGGHLSSGGDLLVGAALAGGKTAVDASLGKLLTAPWFVRLLTKPTLNATTFARNLESAGDFHTEFKDNLRAMAAYLRNKTAQGTGDANAPPPQGAPQAAPAQGAPTAPAQGAPTAPEPVPAPQAAPAQPQPAPAPAPQPSPAPQAAPAAKAASGPQMTVDNMPESWRRMAEGVGMEPAGIIGDNGMSAYSDLATHIVPSIEEQGPGWSAVQSPVDPRRMFMVHRGPNGELNHFTGVTLGEDGKILPDSANAYTNPSARGRGYTAQAIKKLDEAGLGMSDAIRGSKPESFTAGGRAATDKALGKR